MDSGKSKNIDTLGWLLFVELLIIGLGGAFLFFYWNNLPPLLPWFYSLPWGEGQLISKIWFGIGLAILGVVSVINYLLSLRLKGSDEVVALVVGGSTLLLIGIYFASFVRVVLIMLWSL